MDNLIFNLSLICVLAIGSCNAIASQTFVELNHGYRVSTAHSDVTASSTISCANKFFALSASANNTGTATYDKVTKLCEFSADGLDLATYVNDANFVTFVVDCGTPPSYGWGSFVASAGTTAGKIADAVCNAGYVYANSSNSNTSQCGNDGQWTTPLVDACDSTATSAFGTTFVTAFMWDIVTTTLTLVMVSTELVTVNIQIPFLAIDQIIEFNGLYEHGISSTLVHTDILGAQAASKGVYISSTLPIAVFSSVYYSYSSGAHLVYPDTALSADYYVICFPSTSNSEEFLIVGTEDNTAVTIEIPSVTSISITLDRLGSYQYMGAGLSGTHITATSNVVVIAGHECGNAPNEATPACDYMVEQMVPTEKLRTTFIISQLYPRLQFTIQIVATVDGTSVTIYDISGAQLETFVMNRATTQVRTYLQGETISVIATNGILLTQIDHGSTVDSAGFGDPSTTLIPGIDQYESDYRFAALPQYSTHYVMVIMSTTYDIASIILDNVTVSGNPNVTISVPGHGTFTVIHISIVSGHHTLKHTEINARYGAIVYGGQVDVGYSFSLGMSI